MGVWMYGDLERMWTWCEGVGVWGVGVYVNYKEGRYGAAIADYIKL